MTKPQAWAVVPVEPTEAMARGAMYAHHENGNSYDVVRRAIAAAPSPDTDAALVERLADWLRHAYGRTGIEPLSMFVADARELLMRVIPGEGGWCMGYGQILRQHAEFYKNTDNSAFEELVAVANAIDKLELRCVWLESNAYIAEIAREFKGDTVGDARGVIMEKFIEWLGEKP